MISKSNLTIYQLHRKHIANTPKDFVVVNKEIAICNLTHAVQKGINVNFRRVCLKSRVLKHIYDKRTAQVYDFIKNNLGKIIKFPDVIYRNHSCKRGGYLFEKLVKGCLYCVVIEEDSKNERFQVVTVFPTTKAYLKKFKKLWSWKGGNPHRNTLDAI
jgi:hypothetical protein